MLDFILMNDLADLFVVKKVIIELFDRKYLPNLTIVFF